MIDIKTLSEEIKTGKRATVDVEIIQFFQQLNNGEYVPDQKSRIQVRNRDRDLEFIERIFNRIQNGGSESDLNFLTCVYFPETDTTKLINGNHTVEIALRLGLETVKAVVIDFEKELGGKLSNVIRLGNLLNNEEYERNPISIEDVKGELYEIMDERLENGECATPTEEQITELLELYPFVNRRCIGQYISYHKNGGTRRAPLKSYTRQALKDQHQFYTRLARYQGWLVLEPRTIDSWSHTAISETFSKIMVEFKDKTKDKNVLVPFYCKSIAQAESLEKTKKKIENHYKELSEYWNINIECDFLLT